MTYRHWDFDIRSLTSESLAKVVKLNPGYVIKNILPLLLEQITSSDLFTVHGSLLSIAQITIELFSEIQLEAPKTVQSVISVPKLLFETKSNAFQSFGSDLYRQAVCRLIESLCQTSWPVTDDDQTAWLTIIKTSLERSEPLIQEAAAYSYRSIVSKFGYHDETFQLLFSKTKANTDAVIRRGFALALGKISVTNLTQLQ